MGLPKAPGTGSRGEAEKEVCSPGQTSQGEETPAALSCTGNSFKSRNLGQ